MITKTLMGVDFFDEYYGGVYRGRPVLVSGRKGLGKTAMGLQFLRQGLQQDECCLMLSTLPANNLDIYADTMGFSLAAHVNAGRLILLECSNFTGDPGSGMLPPEGFNQLREIIDSHMIQRVVIDTIVPLVAVNPPARMNEHIYSFMRSFDRLGVTTLMTMPKPVSPMAIRLKNALEAALPISILLNTTEVPSRYNFQVVKYLGAAKLAPPALYEIKMAEGIVRCASTGIQPPVEKGAPAPPPPSGLKLSAARMPTPLPAPVPPPAGPREPPPSGPPAQPTRLQDAYAKAGWAGAAGPTAPEPKPAPDPRPPPVAPPSNGKLRFSAVWAPNTASKKTRNEQAKPG